MDVYAGIGSRSTPPAILTMMTDTAVFLEAHNYKLHSGGADGADKAFAKGAPFLREIFYAKQATHKAMTVAQQYHPNWDACSIFARRLLGRNAFQILGRDLQHPVRFVICWTPDGCETHDTRSIKTGGTGTAISIADGAGIRVYNLFNQSSIDELREVLRGIKERSNPRP